MQQQQLDSSPVPVPPTGATAAPRYAPNTLIAYEYLEPRTHLWKWELATVRRQVGARAIDVDLWSSTDPDAAEQHAGSKSRSRENEERRLSAQLHRTQALIPDASPITQEGREIQSRLREKGKALEEEMALVRGRMKQLKADEAAWRQQQEEAESAKQRAERELLTAKEGVSNIHPRHLYEIQSYRTPPAIVKLVLQAVMILLGRKVTLWADTAAALRSGTFLQDVLAYDGSSLTAERQRELQQKCLANPHFNYEEARRGSYAIGRLYQWVLRVSDMMEVTQHVDEQLVAQERRQEQVALVREELKQQTAHLAALEEEVRSLAEDYERVERGEDGATWTDRVLQMYTPRRGEEQEEEGGGSHSPTAEEAATASASASASAAVVAGAENAARQSDLERRWYRPDAASAKSSTLLLSSVLCELGPSPRSGSSILLDPWQRQCIEDAFRRRESGDDARQQESPSQPHASPPATRSVTSLSGKKVRTLHTKVFPGDEWDMVVEDSPDELRQAVVNDVAGVCDVPNRAITNVSTTVGSPHASLHVSFEVEHDATLCKAAVQALIEDEAYPETTQLYGKRHARREEVEAAITERFAREQKLQELLAAKRAAQEAESRAWEEAARMKSALQQQQEELVHQLAVAQTSSQAEALEELREQIAFHEAVQDASQLQLTLEEKQRLLDNTERELSQAQSLLKDQEIQMERGRRRMHEKEEALQQALETLQSERSNRSSIARAQMFKTVGTYTKTLTGDEWGMVLEDSPDELRQVIVSDVAAICEVPNRAITNVTVWPDTPHASFEMTHDDMWPPEEVQQLLDASPFPETAHLYDNRHSRRAQLEAAAMTANAEREAQATQAAQAQAQRELEEARRAAAELRERAEALQKQRAQEEMEAKSTAAALEAQLVLLQQQLLESREQQRLADEARQHTAAQVAALQQQIAENSKQLQEANRRAEAALQEMLPLREQLEVGETATRQLEGQRAAHFAEREKLEIQKAKLKEDNAQLQQQLEELQEGLRSQQATDAAPPQQLDEQQQQRALDEAKMKAAEEVAEQLERARERAAAAEAAASSPSRSRVAVAKRKGTYTKTIPGEEWDIVLEDSPEELRQAIVDEVAVALDVPNRTVTNVAATLGSLHATFDVEHDARWATDEVQGLLDEAPFTAVKDLYENRRTRRAQLQAEQEAAAAGAAATAASREVHIPKQQQQQQQQLQEDLDRQRQEMAEKLTEYEEALQKAEITEKEASEVARKREKELQEVHHRIQKLEAQHEKERQERERVQRQLTQSAATEAQEAERKLAEYKEAVQKAEAAEKEASETARRREKELQDLSLQLQKTAAQAEKERHEKERVQQQLSQKQQQEGHDAERKIAEYKEAVRKAEAAEKEASETARKREKALQDANLKVQRMEQQSAKEKEEREQALRQLTQKQQQEAKEAEKKIAAYKEAVRKAEAAEKEASEAARKQQRELQDVQQKVQKMAKQSEKEREENGRLQQSLARVAAQQAKLRSDELERQEADKTLKAALSEEAKLLERDAHVYDAQLPVLRAEDAKAGEEAARTAAHAAELAARVSQEEAKAVEEKGPQAVAIREALVRELAAMVRETEDRQKKAAQQLQQARHKAKVLEKAHARAEAQVRAAEKRRDVLYSAAPTEISVQEEKARVDAEVQESTAQLAALKKQLRGQQQETEALLQHQASCHQQALEQMQRTFHAHHASTDEANGSDKKKSRAAPSLFAAADYQQKMDLEQYYAAAEQMSSRLRGTLFMNGTLALVVVGAIAALHYKRYQSF